MRCRSSRFLALRHREMKTRCSSSARSRSSRRGMRFLLVESSGSVQGSKPRKPLPSRGRGFSGSAFLRRSMTTEACANAPRGTRFCRHPSRSRPKTTSICACVSSQALSPGPCEKTCTMRISGTPQPRRNPRACGFLSAIAKRAAQCGQGRAARLSRLAMRGFSSGFCSISSIEGRIAESHGRSRKACRHL